MQGFPVGTVVPPEDLVGREAAVADLVRRLGAGQHLFIAAPRQVGKTSVLEEALRQLARQGHPTMSVMVMGLSSWSELAQAITTAAVRAAGRAVQATAAVQRLLRGLEAALLASHVTVSGGGGGDVTLSLGAVPGDDVARLLREALSLPDRLGRRGKRAVVCFDEFQRISALPGDLPGLLRAEMIRHEHVAYAFLGSRRTMLTRLFVEENQPLLRFAGRWELPGVAAEAWEPYLVRKFGELGLRIEAGAARQVVHLSGGHPYDTMLLAQEAFLASGDPRRPPDGTVRIEDIDRAYDNGLQSRSGVFAVEWERCDPAAQSILRRVAHRLPVWPGTAQHGTPNANQVRRAIARLIDDGVLTRQRRGTYTFFEPMMEDFVRRTALGSGATHG